MALGNHAIPFGLRDVKLFAYDAAGTLSATGVDLPGAQTFSFTVSQESEELRGDDGVIATRSRGKTLEWSTESGGLPFEAMQIMYGGEITDSGVTPGQVKTWSVQDVDNSKYFALIGQAINDKGGDTLCKIYKCKATGELSGELADGTFYINSASGTGLAVDVGGKKKLFDWVWNETMADVTSFTSV